MSKDMAEIELSEGGIITVGHNYPESVRNIQISRDIVYLEVFDQDDATSVASLTPEETKRLISELESVLAAYELEK